MLHMFVLVINEESVDIITLRGHETYFAMNNEIGITHTNQNMKYYIKQ